ncbi:MAG: dTDP-4-dehydrorhamnose reductase [Clostridia bacterium]|nr:dTDP-4-dehydrorhamnose reductase [Clostridia bacterium]
MKILLTGSNGQLGNTLQELLKTQENSLGTLPEEYKDCEVIAVDVEQLDITNRNEVSKFIDENRPDLIINCAAMTNVDGCETNREAAEAVNAHGPENLALAAKETNAKIVHVSTDYVFRGDADKPYVETDQCAPVTAYGASKRNGELKVIAATEKHFIFRTSWLYGLIGNNFVKTIRKFAKERGALTVVNDQRGNPTNCEDLAYHILLAAITQNYGVYHCTGKGECTWFDFAKKIVEYSNIPCTVDPCTTEQSNRPAKRPAYSSLDNRHLRETVGDHMREWTVALKEYIQKLDSIENN